MTRNQTTRYVAFLRGINVGGNKLIKMEDLRRCIAAAGFKNVRTFIASGNVLFDAPDTNPDLIARNIEKKLRKTFAHEIAVVVLKIAELRRTIKFDPFKHLPPSKEVMLFVTFLSSAPSRKIKLPMRSVTENLEVIAVKGQVVFMVARHKKNGWFGFPSNYLEKELAVIATTRNWSTVKKIAALEAA